MNQYLDAAIKAARAAGALVRENFGPPLKINVEEAHDIKLGACLARLERSCAGEGGDETGGALGASSRQRSEDLPGARAILGFVTT